MNTDVRGFLHASEARCPIAPAPGDGHTFDFVAIENVPKHLGAGAVRADHSGRNSGTPDDNKLES